VRISSYDDLQQPHKHEAKAVLAQQFHEASALAKQRFAFDDFAEIQDSKLTLKRDDKVVLPPSVKHGQDLPYTGGEFSGLVSKRLNKYQKPSIQAFPEEGFMFSNPRGSYHEMSWQVIRESA